MKLRLDYPDTDILLECTSEFEREKRIRSCAKEPETIAFIHGMEQGSVFWDVGANVGAYSLVAGTRGIKTYAFEPHPPTYRHLLRNVMDNNLAGIVTVYPWVLSDVVGEVGLAQSCPEPGAALHQVTLGEGYQSYTMDSLVDRVGLEIPDYIKIDTDGHELSVVMGGHRVLGTVKAVQVEVDDSLPLYESLIGEVEAHGLRIDSWHRHGATSVSNVVFRR